MSEPKSDEKSKTMIRGPYRVVRVADLERARAAIEPAGGLSEQQLYLIAAAMVAYLRHAGVTVGGVRLDPRSFDSDRGRHPVSTDDDGDRQNLLDAIACVPNGLASFLEAAWSCRFDDEGKRLIRLLAGQIC
jgi:hypothetical protein